MRKRVLGKVLAVILAAAMIVGESGFTTLTAYAQENANFEEANVSVEANTAFEVENNKSADLSENESKTEVETEQKIESDIESKNDSEAEIKSDSENESQFELGSEPKIESETDPETELEVESEAGEELLEVEEDTIDVCDATTEVSYDLGELWAEEGNSIHISADGIAVGNTQPSSASDYTETSALRLTGTAPVDTNHNKIYVYGIPENFSLIFDNVSITVGEKTASPIIQGIGTNSANMELTVEFIGHNEFQNLYPTLCQGMFSSISMRCTGSGTLTFNGDVFQYGKNFYLTDYQGSLYVDTQYDSAFYAEEKLVLDVTGEIRAKHSMQNSYPVFCSNGTIQISAGGAAIFQGYNACATFIRASKTGNSIKAKSICFRGGGGNNNALITVGSIYTNDLGCLLESESTIEIGAEITRWPDTGWVNNGSVKMVAKDDITIFSKNYKYFLEGDLILETPGNISISGTSDPVDQSVLYRGKLVVNSPSLKEQYREQYPNKKSNFTFHVTGHKYGIAGITDISVTGDVDIEMNYDHTLSDGSPAFGNNTDADECLKVDADGNVNILVGGKRVTDKDCKIKAGGTVNMDGTSGKLNSAGVDSGLMRSAEIIAGGDVTLTPHEADSGCLTRGSLVINTSGDINVISEVKNVNFAPPFIQGNLDLAGNNVTVIAPCMLVQANQYVKVIAEGNIDLSGKSDNNAPMVSGASSMEFQAGNNLSITNVGNSPSVLSGGNAVINAGEDVMIATPNVEKGDGPSVINTKTKITGRNVSIISTCTITSGSGLDIEAKELVTLRGGANSFPVIMGMNNTISATDIDIDVDGRLLFGDFSKSSVSLALTATRDITIKGPDTCPFDSTPFFTNLRATAGGTCSIEAYKLGSADIVANNVIVNTIEKKIDSPFVFGLHAKNMSVTMDGTDIADFADEADYRDFYLVSSREVAGSVYKDVRLDKGYVFMADPIEVTDTDSFTPKDGREFNLEYEIVPATDTYSRPFNHFAYTLEWDEPGMITDDRSLCIIGDPYEGPEYEDADYIPEIEGADSSKLIANNLVLDSGISTNLIFDISDEMMQDKTACLEIDLVNQAGESIGVRKLLLSELIVSGELVQTTIEVDDVNKGNDEDEIPVVDEEGQTGSGSKYLYKLNIPAKNMADKYYITLVGRRLAYGYNEEDVTEENEAEAYKDTASRTYEFCVQDYANTLLEDEDSSEELVDLLIAILNYGSYAQTFFGYEAEEGHLANSILWDHEKVLGDVETTDDIFEKEDTLDAVKYVGNSLVLTGNLEMRVYFKETANTALDAGSQASNGETEDALVYRLDGEAVEPIIKGNYKYVSIKDISIADLAVAHEICITPYGVDDAAASENALNVRINPINYIALTAGKGDSLANVTKALYIYSQKAIAYVQAQASLQ